MLLLIDGSHAGGWVPCTRGDALGRNLLDLDEVLGREANLDRLCVLLNPRLLCRAGNRYDVAMREQPGECQLGERAALPCSNLLDPVHECEVLLKVLTLKPRILAAPVIGGDVIGRAKVARQEAAAQGT